MPALVPRYYYGDECYQYADGTVRCHRSAWNSWVRWVVLAVIVVGFFLFFFICACVLARRRRRQGRTPYYGTGWAAKPPAYNTQQPYYNNQPAPPYTASNAGYYGSNQPAGENQGYYQQQNGVELQSPQAAYHNPRAGEAVYTPPPGPPPNKANDGVVR